MSVEVTFEFKDYATPEIERKIAGLAPMRLAEKVAGHLKNFLKQHLSRRPRNKKNWPSTRFWERAADAVDAIPREDGLLLQVDHQGLRQRWKGGPIPNGGGSGKWLTIPLSPDAYGHRAGEFKDLFVLRTKKGIYLVRHLDVSSGKLGRLKRREGSFTRRERALGLQWMYRLLPGVVQSGDPSVIPTTDEFAEVAMAAIQRAIK